MLNIPCPPRFWKDGSPKPITPCKRLRFASVSPELSGRFRFSISSCLEVDASPVTGITRQRVTGCHACWQACPAWEVKSNHVVSSSTPEADLAARLYRPTQDPNAVFCNEACTLISPSRTSWLQTFWANPSSADSRLETLGQAFRSCDKRFQVALRTLLPGRR